jgi:hypothetical protein
MLKRLAKQVLASFLAFSMILPGSSLGTLQTHAEEVQTYEELYYLGYNEDQVLPGEQRYLGTGIGYYLQDEEHPEGEEFEFPVLQLEMNKEYTWGEDGERIPTDREIFYLYAQLWSATPSDRSFPEKDQAELRSAVAPAFLLPAAWRKCWAAAGCRRIRIR